ncbi:MAG: helix-turn-helix transcriptional regulator [Nostoc sp. DedQUE12a]|nr:helix-turn-helix transcriptional regulator [Nostoc sp. DedQUE12a]
MFAVSYLCIGYDIHLQQRCLRLRERDPRSVEELAKAAEMTRANWYRIEREENDVLSEAMLRKIEEVLGVDFGINFEI